MTILIQLMTSFSSEPLITVENSFLGPSQTLVLVKTMIQPNSNQTCCFCCFASPPGEEVKKTKNFHQIFIHIFFPLHGAVTSGSGVILSAVTPTNSMKKHCLRNSRVPFSHRYRFFSAALHFSSRRRYHLTLLGVVFLSKANYKRHVISKATFNQREKRTIFPPVAHFSSARPLHGAALASPCGARAKLSPAPSFPRLSLYFAE